MWASFLGAQELLGVASTLMELSLCISILCVLRSPIQIINLSIAILVDSSQYF